MNTQMNIAFNTLYLTFHTNWFIKDAQYLPCMYMCKIYIRTDEIEIGIAKLSYFHKV
jgi:hypothetical protein